MMEEEDTKRFDSVHGGNDEDNQPDPDEPLMMDTGHGRVWLVKVHTLSAVPTTTILSCVPRVERTTSTHAVASYSPPQISIPTCPAI